MSYGRFFGMRDFSGIVRQGRNRVPSTGTKLFIGEPVMLDAANPNKLKAATEAAAPRAGGCGVVIYEHIQNKSDALVTNHDDPYNQVPLGEYAQMVHGVGVKVWFKNLADRTLYDGRVQTGRSFIVDTIATTMVGKGLVPDGAGKWRLTDDSATADIGGTRWLTIEHVNVSTGVVEARFEF